MSLDVPARRDAARAFERSVATLDAMLQATPLSLPELLTQAWICGHHAARAGMSLGELVNALPTLEAVGDASKPYHDEVVMAAASAHLAARQQRGEP